MKLFGFSLVKFNRFNYKNKLFSHDSNQDLMGVIKRTLPSSKCNGGLPLVIIITKGSNRSF